MCESAAARAVLAKGDLRLVRCSQCGMIFSQAVEPELSNGAFYSELAARFYLSADKLDSDYSSVRFEREIRLFRRFSRAGRVLDVGCSTGAFLYQLQQRFQGAYELVGLDVAGPALDFAESKGLRVVRDSYLTADLARASFSAVTLWAVLEHIVNPRDFLSRTADLLEPAGHSFILVPNFHSLAVRVLGAKYRYILPQHVNYFTPRTLRRLVATEPRFQIAYSGQMHFNPLVIGQDWIRGGEPPSDAQRAKLLKRTTEYKQRLALRPLRAGLAGIEVLLGKLGLADNLVLVLKKRAA